jgi:hypothetical protein
MHTDLEQSTRSLQAARRREEELQKKLTDMTIMRDEAAATALQFAQNRDVQHQNSPQPQQETAVAASSNEDSREDPATAVLTARVVDLQQKLENVRRTCDGYQRELELAQVHTYMYVYLCVCVYIYIYVICPCACVRVYMCVLS